MTASSATQRDRVYRELLLEPLRKCADSHGVYNATEMVHSELIAGFVVMDG